MNLVHELVRLLLLSKSQVLFTDFFLDLKLPDFHIFKLNLTGNQRWSLLAADITLAQFEQSVGVRLIHFHRLSRSAFCCSRPFSFWAEWIVLNLVRQYVAAIRLYKLVDPLFELLHFLVMLLHVHVVYQWTQHSVCWILVLERRRLLHHKFKQLLWVQF